MKVERSRGQSRCTPLLDEKRFLATAVVLYVGASVHTLETRASGYFGGLRPLAVPLCPSMVLAAHGALMVKWPPVVGACLWSSQTFRALSTASTAMLSGAN